MLGLFTKSARRRPTIKSVRLGVERLDDRIAPAAPVIDTFRFEWIDATTVRLYGHVTDEAVLGIAVCFNSNVKWAQHRDAVCDANGNYSLTIPGANSADTGVITADCTDWMGEAAQERTLTLT